MTDFQTGLCFIMAVFAAGAFRAYMDKNVAIFYLSSSAVAIMAASAALYKLGLFYLWVECICAFLLLLAGTAIHAFGTKEPVSFGRAE